MMPAINSKNGSAALLAKPLIDPSKADMSTENRDRISPRLVRAKKADGQILDVLEQPRPHVRNQRCRQLGVPPLVPDRDDRGEDSGRRQHRENLDQRLEILFAERVVDQKLQAQRHDDVEQRLDQDAEADECQYFLVVLQERFDERIDRRQRAGGFLGGIDNEILVILVVFELKLVVIVFVVVGRRRRLVAGCSTRQRSATGFSSASGATGSSAEAADRSSGDGGLDAMKPTDAARPA